MCGMIGNVDLFLNSLKDVNVESNDYWMRKCDQYAHLSSPNVDTQDDMAGVMQIDIGENQ